MALLVPDEKDSSGKWVSTYITGGVQYKTKSHQTWQDMKSRCVVGSRYQKKRPSYEGCEVSKEFLDFQYFADWYNMQIGNNLPHYDLDKDLLVHGNKIYGEAFCVLLPTSLNGFLVSPKTTQGIYPTGVHLNKCRGKFIARVSSGDDRKYLGSFETVGQAFDAYKEAKEKEAQQWYVRLKSGEFIVDERVINALENWKYKEVL